MSRERFLRLSDRRRVRRIRAQPRCSQEILPRRWRGLDSNSRSHTDGSSFESIARQYRGKTPRQKTVAEPMVRRLCAGGRRIRTFGSATRPMHFLKGTALREFGPAETLVASGANSPGCARLCQRRSPPAEPVASLGHLSRRTVRELDGTAPP